MTENTKKFRRILKNEVELYNKLLKQAYFAHLIHLYQRSGINA